ncbi:MFS transporter [Paenibacillus sp. FSL K6-3182]|uniref:MFS transporter n=1 Tax=Paenibacillus sp. FSL K6-3182 TaxID=2921495 RepID=UPI0030D11641
MNLRIILYLIGFSAFAGSLGQNLYTPLLADMQNDLQTTSYLMSLTISLFLIALAVMQIVFGPLADTKGRRKVLLPALAVYCVASLGCAFSYSIESFLVFRVFQGMGSAAVPVVGAAVIGDLFRGKELAKGMATYQLMLLLAPAIGPLLGGLIGEKLGYQGVFFFLSILILLLLLANMKLLPETKPQNVSATRFSLSSFIVIFKNHLGAVVLLYGFVQCVVYLVYLVFLPQILSTSYNMSTGMVGIVLLIMSACTILSIRVGSWMRNRMGSGRALMYAFLLQSIIVVLFALTANLSLPILIVDVCLFGLTMGLTVSMPTTILAEQFPEERATAIGVYNLIRYIGMAIGPMIGSLLYVENDLKPLFLTCGIAYLISVLAGGVWLSSKRLRVIPS